MAYVAASRLRWGDGWIEPGEAVPEGEPGRNYAHLLRLGLIREQPESQTKSPGSTQPRPERPEPDVDWEELSKQYHKGFGRYDIPGVGVVQGKEAAIAALRAQAEATE